MLWLLYFKTVSIEFREYYDGLQLAQFGHEAKQEMCIGNVMQILCPGRFASQMDMRRHFSVEGRLFVHHLVRMEAGSLDRSSILEVELEMPQQVVAWITADTNRYYIDCPFEVEWPEDSLDSLVLPSCTIQQVLALVENYDEYRTTRERLGMDRLISYGRGVAILAVAGRAIGARRSLTGGPAARRVPACSRPTWASWRGWSRGAIRASC